MSAVTVRRNIGLALALALCTALPVSARIIYVDDDANAPGDGFSWQTAYTYLQDALRYAHSPDDIRVAQGVYRPDQSALRPWPGSRYVSFGVGLDVVLKGGYAGLGHPDPNVRDVAVYPSILSGDLDGNDVDETPDWWNAPTRSDNCYCVVEVFGSCVLDGLVITGGQAQVVPRSPWDDVWEWYPDNEGGGLRIWASNVIVKDCIFKHNYAEDRGGGAYVTSAAEEVMFTGCTFVSNAAAWEGGDGMYVAENSSIEVTDCNFVTNLGAGLSVESSAATVARCRFLANKRGVMADRSMVRLSECILRGNTGYTGGALYVRGGQVEVTDSCFTGNRARRYGGAIANDGLLQLTRCQLSGNRASIGGGAIVNVHATLGMANCTMGSNKAPQGSGLLDKAIFSAPAVGNICISNCILSNDGNEIWSDGGSIVVAYTTVQSGRNAIHSPRDVDWRPGNLDVDPWFAEPGNWDPNDTPDDPNDDFWVDGDYHLKSQAGRWDANSASWVIDDVTSLCIDAGDPNSLVGDEPPPNGCRINMGAYGGTAEASKSYFGEPLCETIIAGDVNGDRKVDFADLAILVDHWYEGGSE